MKKKYIQPKWLLKSIDSWKWFYYVQISWLDITHNLDWIQQSVKFLDDNLLNMWFIEAPTEEVKGDWISKVMNDMEHIKFHIDSRYCDWEQCKKEVIQSIEKHKPMPFDNEYYKKPVEQELIPLLPRDIVAITDEIITLDELGKVDEDRIHKVLSKYWVHKQEEKEDWTDEEIKKWIYDIRWWTKEAREYGIQTIKWFLTFHWIHKGSFKKRSEMTPPTTQATSVIDVEEVVDKIMSIFQNNIWYKDRERVKYVLSSLPIQKKRSSSQFKKEFWELQSEYKYDTSIDYHLKFMERAWLLQD